MNKPILDASIGNIYVSGFLPPVTVWIIGLRIPSRHAVESDNIIVQLWSL